MLCILHIGGEKTGTTSLQKFLGTNRDAVLQRGFWYPRTFAHPSEHVHRRLTDAIRSGFIEQDGGSSRAFRSEMDEAGRWNGVGTAVMSSEFFHSQIDKPELILRTQRYLSQFFDRFQIVFYARRQDHTLASMYSTAVRGAWTTGRDPMSVYDGKGHYYFDQKAICDNWAAVFGKDAIICRIFEHEKLVGGDIIEDFAMLIGLKLWPGMKRFRANKSLSVAAIDALRLLHESRHRDNEQFKRKLLNADSQRNGQRIPLLARSDAVGFVAKFQDSNRSFFEQYIDPQYATAFGTGFDRFPETVPPMSAEDIIQLVFSKP